MAIETETQPATDPGPLAAEDLLERIYDGIVSEFHDRYGVCGHCSRRFCEGRKSHSILPLAIVDPTQGVLDAIRVGIRRGLVT